MCQFESLKTYGLNYVYTRIQNGLFVSPPAGLDIDYNTVKYISHSLQITCPSGNE